jgi:hypothetical protein
LGCFDGDGRRREECVAVEELALLLRILIFLLLIIILHLHRIPHSHRDNSQLVDDYDA